MDSLFCALRVWPDYLNDFTRTTFLFNNARYFLSSWPWAASEMEATSSNLLRGKSPENNNNNKNKKQQRSRQFWHNTLQANEATKVLLNNCSISKCRYSPVSQVSVRITRCVNKGCRLSYQCFLLVSLSLCFLLIKTTDNKRTVSMPAVIKAVNNSKRLNNSKHAAF